MWGARKPGKIIGGAWETRGVSAGGATAKVLLLRPNTPVSMVACLTTRGTAWPPACVPNTGGPNLRGRRRGTPILGKQATHCSLLLFTMHELHRCVPAWPPLCATLFTKISFKQTKNAKTQGGKEMSDENHVLDFFTYRQCFVHTKAV